MSNITQLENIPFWHMLDSREKEYIRSNTSEISCRRGTLMYSHDMACLGVIYILRGRLRVAAISEEGREVTLFRLSAGDHCVFAAACALSQITIQTEMVTEEDTEMLAIGPQAYNKVMQENPELKCATYELILKRMSKVTDVMSRMLFERVDFRLAKYLLNESCGKDSDTINKTQESIAAELNTAREVVARLLKRFAKDGLITVMRGKIRIVNREELINRFDI